MNPTRIQAANYGPFETLDLELPLGATAIIGPNGAGKSTIVDAIDLALFGARSFSDYLSDFAPDEEMTLAVEFEHRGSLYRVRRTYSGRGRGKSALDFEHCPEATTFISGSGPNGASGQADGQFHASGFATSNDVEKHEVGLWQPLTREDQKATQALIEATIGLSRETFRASAFLAQGEGAAFTAAAPRERKEILSQVLGLETWSRLTERVRLDIGNAERTLLTLSAQIEGAAAELATRVDRETAHAFGTSALKGAETELRVSEIAHKAATEALSASRELAAKLGAAREVLAVREGELGALVARRRQIELALEGAEALPGQKAEAAKLAATVTVLERELDMMRADAETRAHLARLSEERRQRLADATELTEKVEALRAKADQLEESEAGRCDRCEQELGGESKAKALASLREEAEGRAAEAAAKIQVAEEIAASIAIQEEALRGSPPPDEQAKLEEALRAARAAREVLASVEARLEQVVTMRVELVELVERHPLLESAKADAANEVRQLEADAPTEDLEEKVARAYGVLVEARNACEHTRQQLALVTAELERLGRLEAQVAENRREIAKRQSELDLLKLAERAYGKNGIPVWILENAAIPAIETQANGILGSLGGKTAGATIELRTQRELKSSDGLAEALDIVVLTASGVERRYENWSGGEKMRINLALRLALGHLLATRRGAEVQILILDEPSDLDDAGKAELVEILGAVHALGIERVLLVSHDPDLRDAFDQSIEVVPVDESRSRIETGEREKVAA